MSKIGFNKSLLLVFINYQPNNILQVDYSILSLNNKVDAKRNWKVRKANIFLS